MNILNYILILYKHFISIIIYIKTIYLFFINIFIFINYKVYLIFILSYETYLNLIMVKCKKKNFNILCG